jgi:xanthine permease XanP
MATKPAGLIYGLEDRPPAPVLGLLAVQHIFLMSSTLVLPIVLVNEIGGGFQQVAAVVALTMIGCGFGTVLQALRLPGIGSGFLCPNLCGPNFFAASMGAAWLGGLPLMRGMTIVAGLTEIVFARLFHRLAFLFPAEITGLVVFMVSLSLVPVGTSKFLFVEYAGPDQRHRRLGRRRHLAGDGDAQRLERRQDQAVRRPDRVGCRLCLSAIMGLQTLRAFDNVATMPWLGLPVLDGMWEISFSWSLVPVFVIASICGALKSFGNLVLCEKVNDDDWSEPDIPRVGRGLMADGIAVAACGLLGGMASDTSASNVSLSMASGATSRWIGYVAGALFIVLGFSPKVSAALSIIPSPVAGAIVVFVVCFMMMSGLQIILSTKPDMQRTFVIGLALCFGISLDMLPELYGNVPDWLRPLFGSSLTLATVVAVVLHQLLGIKRLVLLRKSRLAAAPEAAATEASGGGSVAARRSGTDG